MTNQGDQLMSISRRDTILIAVFVNVALISVLFLTASHYDADLLREPRDSKREVKRLAYEEKKVEKPMPIVESTKVKSQESTLVDEVDSVLKAYASNLQRQKPGAQEILSPDTLQPEREYIDVTVKKGDALSKIAKANGTTEKELKRINNLKTERIDVGWVLKVPVLRPGEVAAGEDLVVEMEEQPIVAVADPVYYVVKNGDNPWTIARKHNVRFEDILRLNGLSEEKARNLQIGDKVRVR